MDVFKSQYELIQHTRESLFRYCETMSPTDYVKEVEPLGGASIRNLHAYHTSILAERQCRVNRTLVIYAYHHARISS
jgi:hypothetical protein